jgi:FkbM family methyltransferase
LNDVKERRRQALTEHGTTVLLDVGANAGMYAQEARELGYAGRIISLEPGTTPYEQLRRVAASDPEWDCRQLALGDVNGYVRLNLSANTYSSSLLPITERSVRAAPESAYVGSEDVLSAQLDSIREELLPEGARVFLKLDVQGMELAVLRGARESLDQIDAIEAEVSLQPVYQGQALITEVVAHLDEVGFDLVALEPAFRNPSSGKLLQLDAFFIKRKSEQ